MKENDLIFMAYSSSSHGIKGEFSVRLINEDSSSIKKGNAVYIKKKFGQEFIKYKIESIKYGNKVIIKLEGIDSKTESDAFVPFEIYIPKNEFPVLDEDEFYLIDLVGLVAVDSNSGIVLGSVVDFYETPISTVLQIKIDEKIVDILFNEVFVKDVDMENKVIKIVLPIEIE